VIEEQNDHTSLIKASAGSFSLVVVGLFCHVSQEFLTAQPPFLRDPPTGNAAFSRQSLDRLWIKLEESSNVVGCKDVMQATALGAAIELNSPSIQFRNADKSLLTGASIPTLADAIS